MSHGATNGHKTKFAQTKLVHAVARMHTCMRAWMCACAYARAHAYTRTHPLQQVRGGSGFQRRAAEVVGHGQAHDGVQVAGGVACGDGRRAGRAKRWIVVGGGLRTRTVLVLLDDQSRAGPLWAIAVVIRKGPVVISKGTSSGR